MKFHMPVTSEKVKDHFHYHLWKYVLLAALSVVGWNLLFTITQYRAPEHLRVEFYADGIHTKETGEAMDALMIIIHENALPDMEEVSYTFLTNDDTYGQMQLTVWIAAGQGDVFLLGRERFASMAGSGAMADLQPFIDSGALHAEGLELSAGQVRDSDTGKKGQYGIPADGLPKLWEYGIFPQDAVLSVRAACGNMDDAMQFLDYLLVNMR
ncbi:MAG: hypothetical protein FWF86_05245 [Clostridia bacterium]|nr:hypothetical protein [Clostridia bacterium]